MAEVACQQATEVGTQLGQERLVEPEVRAQPRDIRGRRTRAGKEAGGVRRQDIDRQERCEKHGREHQYSTDNPPAKVIPSFGAPAERRSSSGVQGYGSEIPDPHRVQLEVGDAARHERDPRWVANRNDGRVLQDQSLDLLVESDAALRVELAACVVGEGIHLWAAIPPVVRAYGNDGGAAEERVDEVGSVPGKSRFHPGGPSPA